MDPHRRMGEPKANGATSPLPQWPPQKGPQWGWGIPDGDRTRRGNPSSDWDEEGAGGPHSPSEHPGTAQGPQAMGPPQCLPLLPISPLRKRRRHLLNGAGWVGLGREPISCGGGVATPPASMGLGGTAQPFGQSASGGVATHLPYLPPLPLARGTHRARGSRDGDMGTGTWGHGDRHMGTGTLGTGSWGQGHGDGVLGRGPWGWGQGWGPQDGDPGALWAPAGRMVPPQGVGSR